MKPREAPVVWQKGEGPIDRAALDAYERDGFHLARGVFDVKTVEELRQEAESLATHTFPSAIMERDGRTLRSLFDMHNISELVRRRVTSDSRLIDMAEQILGKGLYVHQCHVNYKRPLVGGEYFWHSDYTFWYWEDGMPAPRAVSMFIFLDDQKIENGPLLVAPGSHKWIVHDTWKRKVDDHSNAVKHDFVDDAYVNGLIDLDSLRIIAKDRAVQPVLAKAGDVLLIDANLAHASGPNLSCDSRRILLLILNSMDNKIGTPFSGQKPRPEYISSRTFTPVR